jgi:myo-inositol-1-phosphate synthase
MNGMRDAPRDADRGPLLLLVAGAKGAVGSTLAVAVAALQREPHRVLPYLTTADLFPEMGSLQNAALAGWDVSPRSLTNSVAHHGVVSPERWRPLRDILSPTEIRRAPAPRRTLGAQVERIMEDMAAFRAKHPASRAVLANLLPSCAPQESWVEKGMEELLASTADGSFPDLPFAIAAVRSGIPVVNFTPNPVEIPTVIREAEAGRVPMAGRDGKTGQTYLKVVLASALKARNLTVDGWYSVNILGNEDGKNLSDPRRAAGKLANKTQVLDDLLGYPVGERWGASTHRVHIGYYPPRGDAKEAWDVVDILGLFGMPMSLRLNFLARDSILAAPMVLDLARWMLALQSAGRGGLIPELAFFFKRPLGANPPLLFQDQWAALCSLAVSCGKGSKKTGVRDQGAGVRSKG